MLEHAIEDFLFRGSVYALIAIGYALTYSAAKRFNLAHPCAAVCGVLCASWLIGAHQPLLVAAGGGILAAGAFGIAVERLVLWPGRLRLTGPLGENQALTAGAAAIALFLLIPSAPLRASAGLLRDVWPRPLSARVAIVGFASVAALTLIGVWVMLRRTRLGAGIRAIAANPEAARSAGVGMQWVSMRSAFIASVLGALAGAGVSIIERRPLGPADVFAMQFGALAAVMLGGIASVPGAALGAFAVAAIQVAWMSGLARAAFELDGEAATVVAIALAAGWLFPNGILRAVYASRVRARAAGHSTR